MEVANKLAKIEETINKLSKALLFDRVGKENNNPMLVSFKCHSRSVEKESHNNFEGGISLFDSQLAKLEFFRFCGDDPNVWSTRVEQFFDYQVTSNS